MTTRSGAYRGKFIDHELDLSIILTCERLNSLEKRFEHLREILEIRR